MKKIPLLLFAALATSFLRGQTTPGVDERLKALESQVQLLAQENQQLKQELGWKGDVAPVLPQPGGSENKLIVGGFLQAQAEFGRASDPRWNGIKDRFFFRRARIYLAGTYADFDFKAELDLQGNSLSGGTALNARANEIFVNWHKYSFANVRFGQIKPAYSLEALAADTKLVTIERSLMDDRLADPRQLAMGISGDLPVSGLSYLAVVADGNGPNVSANDNSKFQRSARLAYTPVATTQDRLSLGVNGLWTDDTALAKPDLGFAGNLFTGRREMSGADVEWSHGPLYLNAEWLRGVFKPTNALPAAQFTADGWQATIAYFLIPAKLQALVREEAFDPNTSVGGNTFQTFTVGFNYYLKGEDIKLKVDYLEGHVPGSLTDGGRLLTRMQIVF